MANGKLYTEKEINFIKRKYSVLSAREIAEKLNRELQGIRDLIYRKLNLRLSHNEKAIKYSRAAQDRRTWSNKELLFLKRNYKKLSHKEMAESLNKSINAVKAKCGVLGLVLTREERAKRLFNLHSTWTPTENKKLKALYLTHTDPEIAEILGRTRSSIINRRHKLKLRLPDERRKDIIVEKFLKKGWGWNKGLKGTHFSPATEFKKGHKPANTKYDGCITIHGPHRGKKEVFIRIAERKWIYLSNHTWIKHNGPIPKGMCVWVKIGDPQNPKDVSKIENLELITRAENLRRNRPADLYQRDKIEYDKYVAWTLTHGDPELRKEILINHPELIEMKRAELKLRRELKNADTK